MVRRRPGASLARVYAFIIFSIVTMFSLEAQSQDPESLVGQVRYDDINQKVNVDVIYDPENYDPNLKILTKNPFAQYHPVKRQGRINYDRPEKIKSYVVYIKLNLNGDIDVIESLTINAEKDEIFRGIQRDFPRLKKVKIPYLSSLKNLKFLPFMPALDDEEEYYVPYRYDVQNITRNGVLENYEISKVEDYRPLHEKLNIKIGTYWIFLDHEDYVYEIEYSVKDELRRFEDADEFYWNIIGTDIDFPIDDAQTFIEVPNGLNLLETNLYTGRRGSKLNNGDVEKIGNIYHIRSTQPLNPREGMTISLRWEKGVFSAQPLRTRVFYFVYHFRSGLTYIGSILAFSLLCFFFWLKYGKDPESGPLFPRYVPHPDYSAAGINFIHNNGLTDHRALFATLKSLQFNNDLKLRSTPSLTKITPLEKPSGTDLDPDEKTLLSSLFASGETDPIYLREEYNGDFHDRYDVFRTALKERYSSGFHQENGCWVFLVFLLGASFFLWLLFKGPHDPYSGIQVHILWSLVVIFIFFWAIMGARTQRGQKILGYVDGLKLYLKHADGEQLNTYKVGGPPPPMSMDRYKELLPYAIALNLETPWTNYFESVMPWDEVESLESEYRGFGSDNDFVNFDDVLTQSLQPPPPVYTSSGSSSSSSDYSSSYSSSSSSSSSSSGGGGGGSSGGGGGGGGVSGW